MPHFFQRLTIRFYWKPRKPSGTTKTKDDRLETNRYLRILTIQNIRSARRHWSVSATQIALLRKLTQEMRLSVSGGDLSLLDGKWYVTHAGLLRIARRRRCSGIETVVEEHLSDPKSNRWVFKATVFTSSSCKGFAGYGDADPSNVSSKVRGAELRIAETRAVNRALRKAYGIGICSVEELGSTVSNRDPDPYRWESAPEKHSNNGQPRLRDQLCVLIRQHGLDPALVKAYAADFCGTATLSGASREVAHEKNTRCSQALKLDRKWKENPHFCGADASIVA